MKNLLIPVSVVALMAACASTPQRSERLEQARAEVERLSMDSMAQQAASDDLRAARTTLQEADAAQQQGKPQKDVDHLAYLAMRRAQAGEARVDEARARAQIAQAEQERNRVLMQAREREAQNARESAAIAKNKLAGAQEEIAQLQAKETNRGMVLTLSDVLFDSGRATLKPGADRNLDRLAQALKDNPNTRVLIEGHTDSVGSESLNDELSKNRARAVADALSERGVPSDRYTTKGLGKNYPVASNDTPAGRQQNRRVEIVFSDASGRFAQGAETPITR